MIPASVPSPAFSATLLEQALAAEMAYYGQLAAHDFTRAEAAAWQAHVVRHQAAYGYDSFPVHEDSSLLARYVLELRGFSLHHYMARHLSVEAWDGWVTQPHFRGSCWHVLWPALPKQAHALRP